MALGGSRSGGGGGGSASAVRAGRAFVEASGKDAGLNSFLTRAAARVKAFGKSVAGVGLKVAGAGAAILTPIGAAVGNTVEQTNELSRLAAKLGVTTDALSAFAYAARTKGLSLEDLAGDFENLAERVAEGANGSGEAIDAFNRLGISAQRLKQMTPVEQLVELARAMEGVSNETERLGYLSKFGGDQFQNLNALFKEGADGIRALMAEAGELGAIVSAEDAANAAALSRAWLQIKTAIGGVVRTAAFALLPSPDAVRTFAGAVVGAIAGVRQWVSDNRVLVTTVAAVGLGLVAAGAALVGFGGFVMLAGAGLSGLVAIAAAVKVAVVGAFAAVLSPVGLAVAAIAGIGYALATQTEAGRTATAEIGRLFTDLGTTAKESWGGIVDAVKAGDLALAGKIAVAGLNAAWSAGVLKLTEAWVWAKSAIVDGWEGMITSLSLAFNDWASWVQKQWADVVGVLDFGKDIGQAKADAFNKQQQIEQERQAREAAIRDGAAKEQAARDAFRKQQIDAAQQDVAAARRELAQLVQQARTKAAPGNRLDNGYKPGAPDLPFMQVRGAFRAPDWRQLFGGADIPKKQLDVAKDQLKEEQQQNKVLGDIFQKIAEWKGMRFTG